MVHRRGARGGDPRWMPTQQHRATARSGAWVSLPRPLTALLVEQRVADSDRGAPKSCQKSRSSCGKALAPQAAEMIRALLNNKLSSFLSPQRLPLLDSGGLQRWPQVAYSTTEESAARPVGRYPVPNKKDMPYDIVELMEEVEMKTGFLPNVFKAMSHRPAEFRAFFAYYNAIMNKDTGRLSKADKELIIVATSAVNRCPYCVVAHGALHRIYSKQPALADQVIVNWKLADLSDRDLAMLEFALAVCRADNITEEHFQKLERHGFDREDAWDIGMISAFFAMSNRIAHYINLRPNKEFYTMGRTPGGEKEEEA
uniref:Carboxymuconolactone decarboxylase-like domain-containing protein n=1 Tax=Accipiter nisus TaxID=211598 RepID=A0A8B9RS55_9AVES